MEEKINREVDIEKMSWNEIWKLVQNDLTMLPESVRGVIKSAFVFYFLAL